MTVSQFAVRERHLPGGVVVVTVSGELDIATAPHLDEYLIHLSASGHHRLVLDAEDLTFCDASGIRVLIRARARASGDSGWLRLAALIPRLRRILAMPVLMASLPMFDSVSLAVLGAGRAGLVNPLGIPLASGSARRPGRGNPRPAVPVPPTAEQPVTGLVAVRQPREPVDPPALVSAD